MDRTTHQDAVAIRKAAIPGWLPFKWQAASGDIIVTGGVARVLKSGPRKGKLSWKGCKESMVVVTRPEVESEKARYVVETGNCSGCYGKGEVFQSWHHIEGTKYRKCPDCDGAGKAIP